MSLVNDFNILLNTDRKRKKPWELAFSLDFFVNIRGTYPGTLFLFLVNSFFIKFE